MNIKEEGEINKQWEYIIDFLLQQKENYIPHYLNAEANVPCYLFQPGSNGSTLTFYFVTRSTEVHIKRPTNQSHLVGFWK